MNSNSTLKIAVLGGDGTGPEVVAEGLKVLKAVSALEKFKYELTDFDFGGDRYLRTGEILPAGEVVRRIVAEAEAILRWMARALG